MKKKRRNRGGQKGNQNARTHGFYASSLTPGNRRVLNGASRLIARRYGAQYQLDRSGHAYLKSIVNAGLQQATGALPDPFKFPEKLL